MRDVGLPFERLFLFDIGPIAQLVSHRYLVKKRKRLINERDTNICSILYFCIFAVFAQLSQICNNTSATTRHSLYSELERMYFL